MLFGDCNRIIKKSALNCFAFGNLNMMERYNYNSPTKTIHAISFEKIYIVP